MKVFTEKTTFFKKVLDISNCMRYNGKAVRRHAAIAQQVERILGKDEVASSNLASSSKNQSSHSGWLIFLFSRYQIPLVRGEGG